MVIIGIHSLLSRTDARRIANFTALHIHNLGTNGALIDVIN